MNSEQLSDGDLEEICTCWVCFETFTAPVTLSCAHTFCKECVVKVYQRDANCPFCRRPFTLPLPDPNPDIEAMVAAFLSRKAGGSSDAPMFEQPESILLNLPDEVLVGIYSMLSERELCRSARTCHVLNDITADSYMWRELTLARSPFANVARFNRNWKACYRSVFSADRGWTSGKAGDFDLVTLRGHTNYITSMQLYRNRVVSGSADNTVRVWDMYNSQCLHTLSGHTAPVTSVQFNEVRIASASHDGTVRLADTGTCLPLHTLQHGGGPVNALAFDATKLASAGADGRVKIWNMQSGEQQHTLAAPHASSISFIQIDPLGRIVSGSSDATRVWDVRSPGAPLHTLAAGGTCVSVGAAYIALGTNMGSVLLYDAATGANHATLHSHSSVNAIQTDDRKVVAGMNDSTVKVWDIATLQQRHVLRDHAGPVHAVQFDDKKVVSASADNTIKVWDIGTGNRMYTLLGGSLQARANNPPHPTRPGCSGMSYNEACVLASFNSLVRLYNFEGSVQA